MVIYTLMHVNGITDREKSCYFVYTAFKVRVLFPSQILCLCHTLGDFINVLSRSAKLFELNF